ncbi:MAG: tripartite tricarboxylate transporter TctB family protein [Burkholderiaceae bacterium]
MSTQRKRLPGELIFALLLSVFGAFMLWQAYAISGFESIASAGAFPMAAAAVLLLSALIVALQTVRLPRAEATAGESLPRQFLRRLTPRVLITFTIAIALYMLALEPVGFVLSSYAFLVGSMALLGAQRWGVNLLVSAVALGVVYLVFQTVFSVVLPTGSLLARVLH